MSDRVLKAMNKPSFSVYKTFADKYKAINASIGKKQFIVPYLISSHPESRVEDAVKLTEYLKSIHYMPEQVQDFYPTPSTLSTCMYYTGLDPRTMKEVYVTTNPHEKAMQRALIQYRNPKNYDLVYEALIKAGRQDLIGFEKHCLIKPRKFGGEKAGAWSEKKGGAKAGSGKSGAGKSSFGGNKSSKTENKGKKKTIRNVHNKKKK
jgi:hypothetical protein